MLVPSRKLFCAVEAVLTIAYQAHAEAMNGHAIAAAQELSPRYLEPMLQKLVRAGILRGVRGPTGGYVLGRERRRITLADICAALADDGEVSAPLSPLGEKVLRPALADFMTTWQENLGRITLATLCERAAAANIHTRPVSTHDFTI